MSVLPRWVRFWNAYEPAQALACVRIGVGLVLLADFPRIAELGLFDALWAPVDAGGIGHGRSGQPVCMLYALLGASRTSALVLLVLACASASTLALGLYSRTSALALLFVSTQVAQLSPDADRGVDTLLRNVMIVLAFSQAGRTLSVDAYRKHKRWVSDELVLAWPRYLGSIRTCCSTGMASSNCLRMNIRRSISNRAVPSVG